MTPQDLSALRTRIAAEFERRGWTYDLTSVSQLLAWIDEAGEIRVDVLSRRFNRHSLAKRTPSREDVRNALDFALKNFQLKTNEDPMSLRLLFLAAGPVDEGTLRLATEDRDIRQRVRAAHGRVNVQIESAQAVRPTDLFDEINRFKPTVLHISGHAGPAGITLEDNAGLATDVGPGDLAEVVRLSGDQLKLVVLNSCESADHARPLVRAVPAAIGMAYSVKDNSAREFASQFYSSLAEGVELRSAFDQAKQQLRLANLPGSDIPQLFVRDATVNKLRLSS